MIEMVAKLSTKKIDTVRWSKRCPGVDSRKSNTPAITVMKSQAKNHGSELRVPSTVTAPTGAIRPQRLTPEAVTKLPIDHCIANGAKRISPSWITA
jgi:hypothetical protein